LKLGRSSRTQCKPIFVLLHETDHELLEYNDQMARLCELKAIQNVEIDLKMHETAGEKRRSIKQDKKQGFRRL
jgi:hypothetical protein